MNRIVFALALLLITTGIYAQQGIYKTPDDYIDRKLSFQQENEEKHSIRTDVPFNASVVKVVNGSETIKLEKSGLFGYKDKKNQDFRFYNNNNYRIVDADQFYLYAREVNVSRGKAKTRETRYYFSKDADSPIMTLTLANLKYAFPMSREFHDMLDLQFRSDRELTRYDDFHKEYKLKSIFRKTLG